MAGGTLTAAQICTLARQIAKCPGYVQQSGQFFNLVMQDLLWHRDLRVNLVLEQMQIQANTNGPFPGAVNYLRTYDLWYEVLGQVFFMTPISLETFDSEMKQPQLSNYPNEFAVDSSPMAQQQPQLLYIYPMSNNELLVNHRYFMQQADIVSPETSDTIPWFQDADYLIHATATRLFTIVDDERYLAFMKMGEDMLRKHLIMEGDKAKVPVSIRLDPRMYRQKRSLRPTKVTG